MKRADRLLLPLLAAAALLAAPARPAAAAAPNAEARLRQACETLQRTPLAADELQALLAFSREATNAPALRGRAMAAYALTFLMQGNTNAFERARQVLAAAAPDALPLLTATAADCFDTCPDCNGSAGQTTLCPSCSGSGVCKPCAGSGKKGAAACPACKGKTVCALCAGKRRIKTACPACKGAGVVFKPGARIRDNYNALLAALAAACEENARFAEQFGLAAREADPERRIARLQELLATFPHRTDLAAAQTLLAQASGARDARLAQQRELERAREARAREARELEALRQLRDAADLDRAIATLADYLKAHPDTPALVELQELLAELTARRERRAWTRKFLYGALAGFVVVLLLACLKPLLAARPVKGTGPLPGLDKIDKSKFTDPLSLTSQESRARDASKAATRPPP